jgi:hypothetical protein
MLVAPNRYGAARASWRTRGQQGSFLCEVGDVIARGGDRALTERIMRLAGIGPAIAVPDALVLIKSEDWDQLADRASLSESDLEFTGTEDPVDLVKILLAGRHIERSLGLANLERFCSVFWRCSNQAISASWPLSNLVPKSSAASALKHAAMTLPGEMVA